MARVNENGATDVFEEIPVILIVIVATFFFLMSVTEGIVTYSRRQEEGRLTQDLEVFCDSILHYDLLLFDSEPGRFDSSKLNEKTKEKLSEDFDPSSLGFNYNLTLVDVSLYEERYNWHVGQELVDMAWMMTASVPVIISNHIEQHHSAVLRVTIWG